MDLNKQTTTELKVLRDKVELALSQRKSEVEVPVIRMIGNADEAEHFDADTVVEQQGYIAQSMLKAIVDKNRIFNVKLVMLPQSDYDDMKINAEI